METPKKLKNVKMGNGTLHTVYGFDNEKKLLKLFLVLCKNELIDFSGKILHKYFFLNLTETGVCN